MSKAKSSVRNADRATLRKMALKDALSFPINGTSASIAEADLKDESESRMPRGHQPSQHNGSYYDLPPDCKTLQDVLFKRNMQWNLANILKAAYRGESKGVSDDPVENLIYNLEKIKWFADDYLSRLYEQVDPRGGRNDVERD